MAGEHDASDSGHDASNSGHDAAIPTPSRGRRTPIVIGVVGVVAGLLLGLALLQVDDVREAVVGVERKGTDWPGDRPFTLRQVLLDERDAAAARGDLVEAAMVEARLSQEALRRIEALRSAWMGRRYEATKLFGEKPRGDSRWSYRNTVADFFCFLMQATLETGRQDVPAIAETLAAERLLDDEDGLTVGTDAATGEPLGDDREEQMFATSEYAKDGLLGVLERHGHEPAGLPIGERLREITLALMNASEEQTAFGPISGQRSEEIGNTLQVCNRLAYAFAERDPEFAEACAAYAARVTEAVLFEMFPANHGLPAREFDFDRGRVESGQVWFRDHGNEFFPGLAESYAHAVARLDEPAWADRAARWAPVLADVYEVVFAHGVGEDGLIVNRIDPETREITDARPSDNWGYVLNGVLLFVDAARRHGAIDESRLAALEAGVDAVCAAVGRSYGVEWEPGPDGYYDSIESALYMMHHRPAARPLLADWVDSQVTAYYAFQDDAGFARSNYLDGNFIRTTLMYADWKRGGFGVRPWRGDVAVGLAERDGRAVLVVSAGEAYEGTLVADEARHRAHMRLPWDWPRLNSWPEWFASDGEARVVSAEGLEAPAELAGFRRGVSVSVPAGGRVVVEFEVVGSDGGTQ